MSKLFASDKTRFAKSANARASNQRILTVKVIEARNIKAVNKNSSDPFIILSLRDLGGREIKNETFRTKQQSGTLAPVWNEEFQIG